MNKQIQIVVVIFVILIGWFLIHKKAVSPTLIKTPPNNVELKLNESPAPAPVVENELPKDILMTMKPPSEIVLTEKDNGQIYATKKEGEFTISLQERAGGYDSISIKYLPSILELVDHGFVPSTVSGNPGSRIWTFKAIVEGTTDITIKADPDKGDSSQTIFSNMVEVTK